MTTEITVSVNDVKTIHTVAIGTNGSLKIIFTVVGIISIVHASGRINIVASIIDVVTIYQIVDVTDQTVIVVTIAIVILVAIII